MIKDEIKYDYAPFGDLENVILKQLKGGTNAPIMSPMMDKLIPALARRNPHWEFVCDYRRDTDSGDQAVKFTVFEGNEEIGAVWRDGYNYENYAYDNPRLKAKRQRGWYNKTKDRAVAIRTIEKNFYAKTDAEVVVENFARANAHAHQGVAALRAPLNNTKHTLLNPAWEYALANWETVGPKITGAKPELVEAIPQYVVSHAQAERAIAKLNAGQSTFVYIRGQRYLLRRPDVEGFTEHTTDDLPPHIKLGVAMLKLKETDDTTLTPGVGVRSGEYSFLVLDPEEQS